LFFYASSGKLTVMSNAPNKYIPLTDWLMDLIEQFLTINVMENDGCVFGWYIMRDRSLVTRLREGGDLTTRKLETILSFMQNPIMYNGKKLDLKPLNIKRRELL